MDLSVENVLMFALVVCALYYLMGNCRCRLVEGVKPPHNKEEGACCNMGDCVPPLQCSMRGMCARGCESTGQYYGICTSLDNPYP
jgi:hypothetical protein